MNKILIVANWKCNPTTIDEAKVLFEVVEKDVQKAKNVEVVICAPFVFLSDLLKIKNLRIFAKGACPSVRRGSASGGNNLFLGGQDCFWESHGAFTGEISPVMLKNLGCSYVIIGHSERRNFLNETSEMINKKIKSCLKARLKPILCIGEKEGEDRALVLKQQLVDALKEVSATQIGGIVIAYEPVWAIGTGKACLSDAVLEAVLLMRKILSQFYGRSTAEKVKIIYGGSVKSNNAAEYVKKVGMDGLLVGGASLNASEILKIIKNIIRLFMPWSLFKISPIA